MTSTHATDATYATLDMLGTVAPVTDNGTIYHPDGRQDFTPERIEAIRQQRLAMQEES